MIHGGALWLNLCNYTLSLSVSPARPITLCQPFFLRHTCTLVLFFGSQLCILSLLLFIFLSDPLLAFIPLFVFVSLFPIFSHPLSPLALPSSSLCLSQINYALIYAQLSSQGTLLHIYHPYSWAE